jgi:hypothetical protein
MNAKLLRAVGALSLAVVLASCAGRTHAALSGSGVVSAKASTLVTIGSSATEGDGVPDRFRQAWPYLFFDEAFPVSTTLINAALDGATVANAQVQQMPLVRQVKPDVVAIWLGVDDLAQHTPVGQFSSGLQTLVAAIQAVGVRQVLVADIPSDYGSASSPYDDAIRRVAGLTRSTLVDLQHSPIRLVPSRRVGDQPDASGQRVIAGAFERALKH